MAPQTNLLKASSNAVRQAIAGKSAIDRNDVLQIRTQQSAPVSGGVDVHPQMTVARRSDRRVDLEEQDMIPTIRRRSSKVIVPMDTTANGAVQEYREDSWSVAAWVKGFAVLITSSVLALVLEAAFGWAAKLVRLFAWLLHRGGLL
jgi:hypothetical protein